MTKKKNIIYLCVSIIGFIGILPLMHQNFMGHIQSFLKTQEIPMGMINNGTLGKILKTQSFVRPVPIKHNKEIFQKTLYSSSKGEFQIRLNTDKSSRLRVYWAGKNEKYSQKRSTAVRIVPDRTDYRLQLPNLSKIKKLRVDPGEKSAQFRIDYINILQNGFLPIRIDSIKQFMKINAIKDIDKLTMVDNGLQFISSGRDSQLELKLKPKIQVYNSMFQKKRESGKFYFTANQGGAKNFPSSQVIDRGDIADGLPLISIVVDQNDLYDEKHGIIANRKGRGREWERLSYISYYEGKKLRFSSAAGLRLHGGISRLGDKKSYRLYFRKMISTNPFPGNIISDELSTGIKRMVVHLDRPTNQPFTTSMAFDIAKRVGCIVPAIKPVKFYLNGESQGLYWISEHLSKTQWAFHIGHEDFSFVPFRAKKDRSSRNNYYNFIKTINRFKKDLSINKIKQLIDIDNLTRYIITMIFCGDDDWWGQGVAVLDNKSANAKWYWIVWDMDHSFSDYLPGREKRNHWEKPGLKLVLRDKLSRYDMRQHIFQFLLFKDRAYKNYFVKLTSTVLNHLLTQTYLEKRCLYYKNLTTKYQPKDPFNPTMREFLLKRAAFIRKDLKTHLSLGDIFSCRLLAPQGITFKIDGYSEKNGYIGWYYDNSLIQAKLNKTDEHLFSHWKVNGLRIDDFQLNHIVKEDTEIEAVFRPNPSNGKG